MYRHIKILKDNYVQFLVLKQDWLIGILSMDVKDAPLLVISLMDQPDSWTVTPPCVKINAGKSMVQLMALWRTKMRIVTGNDNVTC